MHRTLVRCAVPLAALVLTTAGCGGGHDSSSRPPTRTERAALQQAVYDYVIAHTAVAKPSIAKMRVSSVQVGSGRPARYGAFATVVLSDPSAGYAVVFLGRRDKGRISGWRVIDMGSARVGCDFGSAVFGSHRQAVLRSLSLDC